MIRNAAEWSIAITKLFTSRRFRSEWPKQKMPGASRVAYKRPLVSTKTNTLLRHMPIQCWMLRACRGVCAKCAIPALRCGAVAVAIGRSGRPWVRPPGLVRFQLNRSAGVEIDRIKRGLSADIEPIAARAAEADICHDFSDRDRAQMHPVRCIAEHAAAGRRPYVAMDVTAKSVIQSLRTGGKQRRFSHRFFLHLV